MLRQVAPVHVVVFFLLAAVGCDTAPPERSATSGATTSAHALDLAPDGVQVDPARAIRYEAPPPAAEPSTRAGTDLEGSARRVRVRYDDTYSGPQAELRYAEVYVPDGPGPHPWMVYVHGGGLTSVGPNRGETFARRLQSEGYAVALVGYRLSNPFVPSQPLDPERIRHPDHVRDIALAVRFLVDNAANPRLDLDPDRRGIMGHSAGALLSGILLANPTFMAEVGLSTTDWKAGILIDSEAYRLDDYLHRNDIEIPLSSTNVFGVTRSRTPAPDDFPVGFRRGPLYDAGEDAEGGSWLYPTLLSHAREANVYSSPHPLNVSSYYNVAAGDPVAPLLMVHGNAPGRAAAANQMAAIATENHRSARVLSVDLSHGQINWYFGRDDLGHEAVRYTEMVVGWLRRTL